MMAGAITATEEQSLFAHQDVGTANQYELGERVVREQPLAAHIQPGTTGNTEHQIDDGLANRVVGAGV